jgi:hypothetical protein
VNDDIRLKLYKEQLEGDGTLMLSRQNARWRFDMAAHGIQSRSIADRLPSAPVIVIAPALRRRRRDREARP